MYKKQLTLMICIFFLLTIMLNFVNSAPPVTQIQQFAEGYLITGTPTETLKQNQDFTYNFFLSNLSNGVTPSQTISCTFYLANHSGNLQFNSMVSDVGGYRSIRIDKGNFSKVGHYPYGIRCNSSSLGGSYVSYFEVTPNGLELTSGRAFVDIGLLIVLLVFLIGCVVIFMETSNLFAKVGSLSVGYLILIAITFVSWNMASDFLLSAPFIAEMFRIIFFVLIVGAFPLIIGAFAWMLLMISKVKEIERLMEKGFSLEDAERRQGGKYK